MHHRVGITTDGGGEMGVVIEGKSVVSDIVHTILSLHHGTQGDGLDEFLLLLALTFVHKCVETLGYCTFGVCSLFLISKLHHKAAQCLELLRVGLVVNTIRQCLGFQSLLHLTDTLCHCTGGK